MRDPGPPRRNPFFEHGSEGAADDPGMGWRDPDDPIRRTPTRRRRRRPIPIDGVAAGGFAALLALAEALGDAQPEAAEHLVAAAHEVVLTVKVLVDATEAALADQRAAMAARNQTRSESGGLRRFPRPASGAPTGTSPTWRRCAAPRGRDRTRRCRTRHRWDQGAGGGRRQRRRRSSTSTGCPSPTGSWQGMLDAITTVVGELRRAAPGRGDGGDRRGRDGGSRRHDPLRAQRARVPRTPVQADVEAAVGLPDRRRQRRERRRVRRGALRCRARHDRRDRHHPRHGDRRRRARRRSACCAARTASRPRSVTSRSTRRARCARAASVATGRRWPPGTRSVRWRRRPRPAATCRACCRRSTARWTRSAARTCRTAARAGAPDALALVDAVRVQRRDRPRGPGQHLRPGGDRDRGRARQRRRPVPRADRTALLRAHRGSRLPAGTGRSSPRSSGSGRA